MHSLSSALAALDADAYPSRILVSGVCALTETLALPPGVSLAGAPHPLAAAATVSGGVAVLASWLTPVRDAWVEAQIPPGARGSVVELDLAAHGLPAGPAVLAGRGCRAYAEGLPEPHGGSMASGAFNSPPGIEFFALDVPSAGGGGGASALRLARWPRAGDSRNWSHVAHTARGAANRTFVPDAATLQRAQGWAQQFVEDPGSVYVHEWHNAGWADSFWPLTGLSAQNLTVGPCGNMSVGESQVLGGNSFVTINVLAELAEVGDFYVNRTSQKLYAWLPPPAHAAVQDAAAGRGADTIVGYVSVLESPLVSLANAVGSDVHGVSLRYGRGVGVAVTNCTRCSVRDAEVAFVGLMGVNISGPGVGVRLSNISLHDTGNGGVYMSGGNRVMLTPSQHVLSDATITRYNRWSACYTPGVVFAGVGHTALRVEIYDAPHQAIFSSGNDHVIDSCSIHDVTQIVKDSGAWYMGRDLTYRGNVIRNTSFYNLVRGWW